MNIVKLIHITMCTVSIAAKDTFSILRMGTVNKFARLINTLILLLKLVLHVIKGVVHAFLILIEDYIVITVPRGM